MLIAAGAMAEKAVEGEIVLWPIYLQASIRIVVGIVCTREKLYI